MKSTRAKGRLGSPSCKQIYRRWFGKKFDVKLNMKKVLYPNITDHKAISVHKLVVMVFKRLGDDTDKFKAYLEYVFGEWSKVEGALIAHWHNWFASEKIIARFNDIYRKRQLVNKAGGAGGMVQGATTTYGDHTYAGQSEDEEFSLGDDDDIAGDSVWAAK